MKVLIVEPGLPARPANIAPTLKAEQEVVGGRIEVVYPWRDSACIVCNEEGLLMGLPPCRYVPDLGEPIHGAFFICGLGEEDFTDLTPEQSARYEAMFHQPQIILMQRDHLAVIDCDPDCYAALMQSLSAGIEP